MINILLQEPIYPKIMKKQNNTITLFYLLLSFIVLTAGCKFQNKQKNDSKTSSKHDEDYVRRVNSGDITNDSYIGSVQRETSATIDSLKIKIQYGSPGVRKRIIWGKLVPFDSVWVSGANTATSIEFSKNVNVEGKKLKAGRYALFTIPGRKSWTVILNTDYRQHNADDYDVRKDVLRLQLIPDTLPKQTQRLTYSITKDNNSALDVALAWEKLRVSFHVKIDNAKSNSLR
jgi:hypothetical protein